MPELQVREIGIIAEEALAAVPGGAAAGATSKGVFLRAAGWVVFLSMEPSRGPLTLNVDSGLRGIHPLPSGAEYRIQDDSIHFPQQNLSFTLSRAARWEAPPPLQPGRPRADRAAHLRRVAAGMLASEKPGGLLPLLASLAGLPLPNPQDASHPFGPDGPPALRRALASGQAGEVAALLMPCLGWGTGLTPSGDDLITGLLLALSRWGHQLYPELDQAALAAKVLQTAYRKTTTLSANLIECAARGQADERLLAALDGILTGVPGPPACTQALSRWGSTSGGDILVGIALAVL